MNTVFRNYVEGGASRTKNTLKRWTPSHYSARREIDWNLELLRSRSASLYKNSAIGSAAINTMTANVIADGLRVFPRIRHKELGLSAEEARQWRRKVKAEFELWAAEPRNCDYLARNNFYELQQIAFNSSLVDGDCFCLMKRRAIPNNPYTLKLQLVEAGRVSNPNGLVEMLNGGNRLVNGIETDSEGRLAAIWVGNRQWNEADTLHPSLEFQRVEVYGRRTGMRNVLQIAKDIRPDQNRGIPYLSPVIESMKQLARYTEAELTSAIIHSYFSVFFTQNTAHQLEEVTGEVDLNEYELGSGTMNLLPPGVDVKALNTQGTQSTFEGFTSHYIKEIGAALNIPYEVLTKHYSSSYSASRAAIMQAENEYRIRKAGFIVDFCNPVYEQWLMEAVGSGRIEAPGFMESDKRLAWSNAVWYNSSNRVLDPQRETSAMITRLSAGISTYEREIANAYGEDFDEITETLEQEQRLREELIGCGTK